jgi:hypothetical protein
MRLMGGSFLPIRVATGIGGERRNLRSKRRAMAGYHAQANGLPADTRGKRRLGRGEETA